MTFFTMSDSPGQRPRRAVRVVPEVADALLTLKRRLEIDGAHRAGDDRHVVMVAHADRNAVACRDSQVAIADDDGAGAFEDDPELVAVVKMGIDGRHLGVGDRITGVLPVRIVGRAEDAAAAEFGTPMARQADDLRAPRSGLYLPRINSGEIDELAIAEHLRAAGRAKLRAAAGDEDALPHGPASLLTDALGRRIKNGEGFQLAPYGRWFALTKDGQSRPHGNV